MQWKKEYHRSAYLPQISLSRIIDKLPHSARALGWIYDNPATDYRGNYNNYVIMRRQAFIHLSVESLIASHAKRVTYFVQLLPAATRTLRHFASAASHLSSRRWEIKRIEEGWRTRVMRKKPSYISPRFALKYRINFTLQCSASRTSDSVCLEM